jgi:uncharacterized repeat protein (TIGR02543 family)
MLAVVAFAFCFTMVALDSDTSVDAEAGVEYDLNGSTLTIKANITSVEVLDLTDEQWQAVKVVNINNDVETVVDGALQKATNVTSIMAPISLKDSMVGIFGTTDYSKATQRYNDGAYFHIIMGVGSTSVYYGYNTALRTIVISSTVKNMSNSAFQNCKNLLEVTFDGSPITQISNNAFQGCTSLESIDLPDATVSVGNYAFQNCTALKSVTSANGIMSVGSYAFSGCTALEEVSISENATYIGSYAFQNCTSLKDAVVAQGTIYVAPYEEDGEYEVPAGVKTISSDAYRSCANMTSIKLSDSLTTIGSNAFSYCPLLSEVTNWPEFVTVGSMAFSGTSIPDPIIINSTLVYVPNTVEEYVITDSIRVINDSVFQGNTNLKKVVFEGDMSSLNLGSNIFRNCTSLEEVVLPEGLQFIYKGMFWGCTSLKSIDLSGITYIYEHAFRETGLESVVIPDSVVTMEGYVFRDCKDLKSAIFEGENVQFRYNQYGSMVDSTHIFGYCSALETIQLPSGMTCIPANMFDGCTSLKSINWPANLVYIGDSAFQNSGITEIILPEGLYYIQSNAFSNCTHVERLVLPSTIMYSSPTWSITPIGTQCFRNLGTETENGADVIIRGSPNFPVNASNRGGTNHFNGAKINDLIIEESPVFGVTTFNNATINRIIVSGGSSFNCSSNLRGISDMIVDGYLTVYVKDGDDYIPGKMMCWDTMGPVEYNQDGAVIDIPADVISIPVVGHSFLRLKYLGFNVDENNPYFTVKDNVLYFELKNNDRDAFEDAKLVYMVRDFANAEDQVMDLVVPEGVTKLGAFSLYNQTYVMNSVSLPTTMEIMETTCASYVSAALIGSEESTPLFEMGANFSFIFVKPTMSTEVADSFVSIPYYNSAPLTIGGIYVTDGDAVAALLMPLGSAEVKLDTDDQGNLVLSYTVNDDYSRSVVQLRDGYAKSDPVIEPEEDGTYKFAPFTGVRGLLFDGLQINHYKIESEMSDAYDVAYSVIDESSVEASTEVTFTITLSPGYEVQDSGIVVKINDDVYETELIGGRYYCTFVVTGDVVITVSGIEPANTFAVTFDSNGGSEVPSQQVVGGETVAYPENPEKDSMAFFGWYLGSALYDFATPVTSDITLKASWISQDADKYLLTYDLDNGFIVAISENTNSFIESGEKVFAGTTVTLVTIPSWGYEVRYWAINDDLTETISETATFVIDENTDVVVGTEYTVSSTPYIEAEISAITGKDNTQMIWKVIGTDGFNGMVYTPSILGDYVYSVSGKQVFKISLFTGEVVKTADLVGSSDYYNFTTVGNGYVLVGYGGQVFDADLNPVFQLHIGTADDDRGAIKETKTFYNDGYFYVFTKDNVYKFVAVDADSSTNNIQYPVKAGETLYTHYISAYQGQSNLIFTDDFIIGIEIGGMQDQYRYLVTYDIETLEAIDSYRFEDIDLANMNTGYISYYNGIAYFGTYHPLSGLFSTSPDKWYTLSSVELDSDGIFNPATVHYYDLGTSSYPSSFVVVGDYGYLNAGDSFYVMDMKTMTVYKHMSSAMAHGNMAVTVNGDKVCAYIIPYQGADRVIIFEHDQTAGTLTNVSINNAVDTTQFSSQIVHFGPHGELLFYNDSGYLFCVAPVYTASFVTNGGAAIPDMSFTISGAELPVAAKDGYTFLGWYDNAAFEGQAVWSIEPGTYDDQTYYAKYVVSDASMLIKSVSIDAFIDGGESVILSVEAGANSPEKVLVVTYSGYIDLPEGRILFPFLTDYVELDKDTNSAVFIPKDVDEIESLAVACYYELSGVTYSTPYAKAVTPPAYAEVELLIEEGATLTMDDLPVYGGDMLKFGYYTVDVISDEAAEYTVNGIAADGENKLYYCGQKLEVSRAAA